MCLHYGWQLSNIPDHCVCASSFNANHAMICQHSGLTFVRHNELHDLTVAWMLLLSPLQLLSGESISLNLAICGDDAQTDIHARGF